MDHKSKNLYSLIDLFMTSEGGDTMCLPFTSKTGQSVAQNRQNIFYLDFLVKKENIFWHFIDLHLDSRLKGYSRQN